MPRAMVDAQSIFYQIDDLTPPWAPGEFVLFHHGYARNHYFWYEWIRFVGEKYRCLRFDMRGHGRSDPLAEAYEPTLESLAADVVRLMDVLDIEKVHFIGESLAGVIGIWLGALHPERVHSLVLLSAPVKVSAQGRADFSAGATSWEAAFDQLSPEEWARRTMEHRFDSAVTDPAYIEWVIGQAAATPVSSLRKYAGLIDALDLSGGIPTVNTPTLQVAGASKLAPAEQARFLQGQIVGSRLELLPQARHLVGYAMPREVSRLALDFWADLSV